MRERPILFSGPMVRAILAGRKTQTRRIVNPQPEHKQVHHWKGKTVLDQEHRMWCWNDLALENIWDFPGNEDRRALAARCPLGVPSDRLWVRETWFPTRVDFDELRLREYVKYAADGSYDPRRDCVGRAWRSPILMPRWASRLTLEMVSVRVERLQEISRADAAAEGMCYLAEQNAPGIVPSSWPEQNFAAGWDRLNGKRAPWASNPWVWVVEFKVAA